MLKLTKKPFLPSAVLIAVDVLILLGAIIINILRGSIEYTYTLEADRIVMHDPLGWYAALAAVTLVLASALTAGQIVLNVLQARKKAADDKEFKGDLLFLNGGSVALLVVSVAVALFAMWFSVPETPESQQLFSYSNPEASIAITEERYSDGALIGKVYDTTHEGDIKLVHTFELQQLSDSAERYTLNAVSAEVLQIVYTDVTVVRTMTIDFSTLHEGHDHSRD